MVPRKTSNTVEQTIIGRLTPRQVLPVPRRQPSVFTGVVRWAEPGPHLLAAQQRIDTALGVSMILLGIILLVLGFIFTVHILWILGIVVLVVGVILMLLGATGRAVGGRSHYF
jgi:hypothetical protein